MNSLLKGLLVAVAALPLAVMAQGNSVNAHAKVEIIQASQHDHNFILRDAPGKPMDTSTI